MKPASGASFSLMLLSIAAAALAHEGEDHAAAPAAISQSLAPRAATASEEFEVVAALEGKQLIVYLDRFASNEPVAGARVEIEGGGLNGIAAESSPGVYAINASAIAPARHPLTISIEAGDSADLLSATLDIAPPQARIARIDSGNKWSSALPATAALALAGAVLVLIRQRKKRKAVQ